MHKKCKNIWKLWKSCITWKSWQFMTRKIDRLISESAFVSLNYITYICMYIKMNSSASEFGSLNFTLYNYALHVVFRRIIKINAVILAYIVTDCFNQLNPVDRTHFGRPWYQRHGSGWVCLVSRHTSSLRGPSPQALTLLDGVTFIIGHFGECR